VSCDPTNLQDGINSFYYVKNNPINYKDPNGEEAVTATALTATALTATAGTGGLPGAAAFSSAASLIGSMVAVGSLTAAVVVVGGAWMGYEYYQTKKEGESYPSVDELDKKAREAIQRREKREKETEERLKEMRRFEADQWRQQGLINSMEYHQYTEFGNTNYGRLPELLRAKAALLHFKSHDVPLERSVGLKGKVKPGTTDLSNYAIEYRRQAKLPESTANVALIEYVDKNGEYKLLAAISDNQTNWPASIHSEIGLLDRLKELGISPEQVTRLYSERALCSTCSSDVGNDLLQKNPNIEVTWSLDYKVGEREKNQMAVKKYLGKHVQ